MTEKQDLPLERGRKVGRPPKIDKANHCVMVRFNSEEYAEFLKMFEKSGVKDKATFLKKHLFGAEFKVKTFDENTFNSYQELKNIKAEVRKIGVNYNQFIVILRSHFTEQRAAMTASNSAKLLSEVLLHNERALKITLQLVRRWLPR